MAKTKTQILRRIGEEALSTLEILPNSTRKIRNLSSPLAGKYLARYLTAEAQRREMGHLTVNYNPAENHSYLEFKLKEYSEVK
jgi:hypothetical protein